MKASTTRQLGLALVFALAGCSSSPAFSGTPAACTGTSCAQAAATQIYAFSPLVPSVAVYSARSKGSVSANSTLQGTKTRLATGHGLAVGPDGTLYVLAGSPPAILVYSPGAAGNDAPSEVIELPADLLADYTVGLALDGRGNVWTADTAGGQFLRFPLSPGKVRANASFSPRIATPIGMKAAHISAMAMDSEGHLYCSCGFLFHGATAFGVTEYDVTSNKPKMLRSFYTREFQELPPSSISIDSQGTIYLASGTNVTSEYGNVIFAYGRSARSGKVGATRGIASKARKIDYISAIATDAAGNLYVANQSAYPAEVSSIVVFPPGADGNVKAPRVIKDTHNLLYGDSVYGTLLVVR